MSCKWIWCVFLFFVSLSLSLLVCVCLVYQEVQTYGKYFCKSWSVSKSLIVSQDTFFLRGEDVRACTCMCVRVRSRGCEKYEEMFTLLLPHHSLFHLIFPHFCFSDWWMILSTPGPPSNPGQSRFKGVIESWRAGNLRNFFAFPSFEGRWKKSLTNPWGKSPPAVIHSPR